MILSNYFLLLAATTSVIAAPFTYPLANGFPNLNNTELVEVFKAAGGTLPNGELPKSLTPAAIQIVQLLAANELFEVAFFTELLYNVTEKVPGYGCDQLVIDSIEAVVNQEQEHVLATNGILASAKAETIQPCKYAFPVTNFDDAIALAATFTDLGLGALPAAQALFAKDAGDEAPLVPLVGSIVAQEGQQSGFYRSLQKKVASAAPFLTGAAPGFVYTAISQFIIPGSCPNIKAIGLSATPALTIETMPKSKGSVQLFSIVGDIINPTKLSIAFISGQNLPLTVPISNINKQGSKTYFFAPFPFEFGFARGLTIGSLVYGTEFSSAADVAAATLYGPALIEVN